MTGGTIERTVFILPTADSKASTLTKHHPRFTISPECHIPAPAAPLTESQQTSLTAIRTYIHNEVATTDAQKRWADDGCLVRYLRSKKWHLEEAKVACKETLAWREVYRPHHPEREVLWQETAAGKLYIGGFDSESRPCLIMKPRNENTAASPTQIRHLTFHLEVAIALMPKGVEKISILIDFAGSSMRTNPGMSIARDIVHVLGSHYPERLGKAYILHAPWFFWPFYKLIKPFIDPVTVSKINFVDMKKQKSRAKLAVPASSGSGKSSEASSIRSGKSSKTTETTMSTATETTASSDLDLVEMVPADMLEDEYGGRSDYEYDQETYWFFAEQVLKQSNDRFEQPSDAAAEVVATL